MKSSLVKISGGILLVMGLVSGCGNQGSQNVTQPNPYYNPSVAAVPTTTTGCPVPGYGYPGTTGYPAGYPAGYPYNTGYAGTTVAGCPSVAGYPAGLSRGGLRLPRRRILSSPNSSGVWSHSCWWLRLSRIRRWCLHRFQLGSLSSLESTLPDPNYYSKLIVFSGS